MLSSGKFLAIAAILGMAAAVACAQSGEATYKAKCQLCHGAAGMAETAAGKSMKVKPISDPDVNKMSEAQMIEAVTNGMGKMQPYKDKLTDAQIKDSVAVFRAFQK